MKKTKIQWLIPMKTKSIEEIQQSNLASIRMRAAIAMSISDSRVDVSSTGDGPPDHDTDVLIIGKLDIHSDASRFSRWISYISEHHAKGKKVVLDYTDNHLHFSSNLNKYYLEIIKHTDKMITSSPHLKEEAEKHFKGLIDIIEDAIEIESPIQPKNLINKPITGLWFGHSSNLTYLLNFLQHLPKPNQDIRLIVMSNLAPMPEDMIQMIEKVIPNEINLHVISWSLESMKQVSEICDFCIIPAGINDPKKAGASSNRLLTSLSLGLPTAADCIGSYLPYCNYFSELNTVNFNDFLANLAAEKIKVSSFQDLVFPKLGKYQLSKNWLSALSISTF